MAHGILVAVKSFDNYRPRKEIKHPHWFKCSNRLLEDEDFYNFTFEEIAVWIYILSVASQKDSFEVFINFEAAERKCRLKEKVVRSAIAKLSTKQIDTLSDHDLTTTCTRHAHDLTTTCVLDREEGEERRGVDQRHALPTLSSIWNEEAKSLPKVRDLSESRIRAIKSFLKNNEESVWADACRKVESSDFLSGRSGKWTSCSFDWLLKPANFTKVIEGNYDNRATGNPATGGWEYTDGVS